MKCELCKKREATIHLTEVINEKVTKLHICEECAKTKSDQMQSHFGLTDLLSGLMDFTPEVTEEKIKEELKVACSTCGMSYYDFQKTGRLGCGRCYDTFSRELSELLIKIHGSDRHIGKMPYKGEESVEDQQALQVLKNRLKELVQVEDFEQAAVLRDKIKKLEEKIGE